MPQHVIQRGNNRGSCFFGDGDRLQYLAVLRELAVKFECAIHAYVLMTNHVHLLMTPRHVNAVSVLMRNLGQRYVQYVNRVHGRTGSLWEGRFRSSLIDSDEYLLTCQRYIELNPVRAGIVRHPADYAWSSFRAHGLGAGDSVVTPHEHYLALGLNDADRRRAYNELFRQMVTDDWLQRVRTAANSGSALGSERFNLAMSRELGRDVAPRARGRPRADRPARTRVG